MNQPQTPQTGHRPEPAPTRQEPASGSGGYTHGADNQAPNQYGNGNGGQTRTQPQSDSPKTAILVAAVVLLVVAVAGLAAYIGLAGNGDSAETLVVPAVIGETQEFATSRLTDAGFTVTVEFREDAGEPGTVFAQVPEAGTEHDPAESVVLFVVIGDETVIVPDVVDRQTQAAQTELNDLGFTVRIIEEPSAEVDEGRVIRQSIEPGQEANIGSEITLRVSTGPDSVDVPDLTNQSQANAERVLIDAGFRPRVELVEVQPDAGSAGNVISQTPGPRQPAAPGAEIIIRVGRTSATTTTTATSTPTTAPQATVGIADPEELLFKFGQAWDTADWDGMRTLAQEPVVVTAMEWFSEGGSANLTDETLSFVLDGCSESPTGQGTQCQFVYAPAEGSGLIFDITYVQTNKGLIVTDLVFGGDAG